MVNWNFIETVFLDMDGTLLDLYYDNFIWDVALPEKFAQVHKVALEQAKETIKKCIDARRGTLNAYCFTHWSNLLGFDMLELYENHQHLIGYRDNAEDFLKLLAKRFSNIYLVTNADRKNINLKIKNTGLDKNVMKIFSSSELGYAKEQVEFWKKLQKNISFNCVSTLLIDDNNYVLEAARDFGINNLLLISRPCSKSVEQSSTNFINLKSFKQIMQNF